MPSLKSSFYSVLHALIDDQITKRLRHYLEIGRGADGVERSDIIISDDHKISLVDAYVKPSAIDMLLAEHELPLHVAMAHMTRGHLSIPWRNLTSGRWTFEIEGLMLVMTPREPEQWCSDDARARKEALIAGSLARLIRRQEKIKAMAKPKRASLMNMLKRKLMQALKPTIHIKDVHIRFERYHGSDAGTHGVTPPFSTGIILTQVDVTTTVSDDGKCARHAQVHAFSSAPRMALRWCHTCMQATRRHPFRCPEGLESIALPTMLVQQLCYLTMTRQGMEPWQVR